jgi:hypothetical protein
MLERQEAIFGRKNKLRTISGVSESIALFLPCVFAAWQTAVRFVKRDKFAHCGIVARFSAEIPDLTLTSPSLPVTCLHCRNSEP